MDNGEFRPHYNVFYLCSDLDHRNVHHALEITWLVAEVFDRVHLYGQHIVLSSRTIYMVY